MIKNMIYCTVHVLLYTDVSSYIFKICKFFFIKLTFKIYITQLTKLKNMQLHFMIIYYLILTI